MPDTTMLGADLTTLAAADRRIAAADLGAGAVDGGFRRVLDANVAAANDAGAANDADGAANDAAADDESSWGGDPGAATTGAVADRAAGVADGASGVRAGAGPTTERSLAPPIGRAGATSPSGAVETWAGDVPSAGDADGAPNRGVIPGDPRSSTLPSPAPEAGSDGAEEVIVATGLHPGGKGRLAAEHLKDAADKARLAEEEASRAADTADGAPGKQDTTTQGATGGAAEYPSEIAASPTISAASAAVAPTVSGVVVRDGHRGAGGADSLGGSVDVDTAARRADGAPLEQPGSHGTHDAGDAPLAAQRPARKTSANGTGSLPNDAVAQAIAWQTPPENLVDGAAPAVSGIVANVAASPVARAAPADPSDSREAPFRPRITDRGGFAAPGDAAGTPGPGLATGGHGASDTRLGTSQSELDTSDPRLGTSQGELGTSDTRPGTSRDEQGAGAVGAGERGDAGDRSGTVDGGRQRAEQRDPGGGDGPGATRAGASGQPFFRDAAAGQTSFTGALDGSGAGTDAAAGQGRFGPPGTPQSPSATGTHEQGTTGAGGPERPADTGPGRRAVGDAASGQDLSGPGLGQARSSDEAARGQATFEAAQSTSPRGTADSPRGTADSPRGAADVGAASNPFPGARSPGARSPDDRAALLGAPASVDPGARPTARGRLQGPAILFPNAESRQAVANRARLAGLGADGTASPRGRPLAATDAQIRGTLDAAARAAAASVSTRAGAARPTGRILLDPDAPPIGTVDEIERAFAADAAARTRTGTATGTATGAAGANAAPGANGAAAGANGAAVRNAAASVAVPVTSDVQLVDVYAPTVRAPFDRLPAAPASFPGAHGAFSGAHGTAGEMRAGAERLASSAATAPGANGALAGARPRPPASVRQPSWGEVLGGRAAANRPSAAQDNTAVSWDDPGRRAAFRRASGAGETSRDPGALGPTIAFGPGLRSAPGFGTSAGLEPTDGAGARFASDSALEDARFSAPVAHEARSVTPGSSAPFGTADDPGAVVGGQPGMAATPSGMAGGNNGIATSGAAGQAIASALPSAGGAPPPRPTTARAPAKDSAPRAPRAVASGASPFAADAATRLEATDRSAPVLGSPREQGETTLDSLSRSPISAASGWSPDTQRDPPDVSAISDDPTDRDAPNDLVPRAKATGITAQEAAGPAAHAGAPSPGADNGAAAPLPTGPTATGNLPHPSPDAPANTLSRLEERMVERRQRVAAGGMRGPSALRETHAEAQIPDFGRISVEARARGAEVDVRVTAHEAGAARALREARPELESHLRDGAVPLGHLALGDRPSGGSTGSGPGGDRPTPHHEPPTEPARDAPRPPPAQRPGGRVRVIL